jgi:hypothetical protein
MRGKRGNLLGIQAVALLILVTSCGGGSGGDTGEAGAGSESGAPAMPADTGMTPAQESLPKADTLPAGAPVQPPTRRTPS